MFSVKFLGVMRRAGVSKQGNNYDICKLFYATPMQSKQSESNNFTAYGYEQRELDLDPSTINQFAGLGIGEEIDLNMVPNPQNPQRNIVSGLVA
jgi:hypothetical protein